MIAWANSIIIILFLAFPVGSAFQVLYKRQQKYAFLKNAPSHHLHQVTAWKHRLYNQYTRLSATASNEDSDDDDISIDETEVQDLRSFISQRCIQSFMFLLASTRDLHTVKWLDSFVKPITLNNYWEEDDDYKPGAEDAFLANDKRLGSKLLNYHGLAALNTTIFPEWDSFFIHLLEQPDTVLMIKTPVSLGHREYSEFDIDIEPARLCARILSVREQLAKEMTVDLECIANMGQQLFESYWQNAKERKDTSTKEGSSTDDAITKSSIEARDNEEESSSPYAFDRPSTMYMNIGINMDPRYGDDAVAPSPLRRGNFDLLYNLITQQAVVDLLASEDGVVVGEDVVQNMASQLFLSNFYQERITSHFVGSQWYGKSDDLIEELMLGSPILMARDDESKNTDEESDETKVSSNPPLEIEPLRIAEQILLRRDKLAIEWSNITKSIPTEHTEIRRLQLNRLTAVPDSEPETIVFEDTFQ